MNLFRKAKNDCTECTEKFTNHEDLVKHVRKIHHHTIVKCTECGQEFIHEKHRLEHFKKEHKEKRPEIEQKKIFSRIEDFLKLD